MRQGKRRRKKSNIKYGRIVVTFLILIAIISLIIIGINKITKDNISEDIAESRKN